MNRSTSGCVTRIMPMFAPRRTPPCFTTSVTWLTMVMNDTGPDATPVAELTIPPCARRNSYVRMCNAHHAHVRTATHATLLHHVCHLVDDGHERHWTRRHTRCGANHPTVCSEKFIRQDV